ncbi:hypothetical protein [uncultured Duncaniella sp.]|uniref:hypothetical protein n=1 Tax=uncultured Duncaniella sp. TaxID=2768039 RepID=UPI002607274E|nr:hypothetical protein [uncultured Duncaniella sp.]
MIIYGYAKDYYYAGDGTLQIRVRIPQIHGAYNQRDYRGKSARNYVIDEALPYYPSLLLPHLPNEGEVVALISMNEANSEFLVIGLTGSSYNSSMANLDET